MNETPASPVTSQDSILAKPVNPIWEGMKKGAIVALGIAVLYALAVPMGLLLLNEPLPPLPGADASTNPFLAALVMSGMALLVGGIPALILGAIGGGIIGAIFRYGVKHQVSTARALFYGFCISLAIVSIRLIMLIQSDNVLEGNTLADPLFWVMVIGPMLGAFLGFWWVAYQVNAKMPQAV